MNAPAAAPPRRWTPLPGLLHPACEVCDQPLHRHTYPCWDCPDEEATT